MYQSFIKRALDVVFSIILLPIAAIICIPFMIAIYIEDRGPIFYNAPRLGKNMRSFKMYKLRSMRVGAPDIRNDDGSTFNSNSDPRVSKVGRVIRKLSIDELPQILNVLFGDMSFVGPRPSPLGNENRYTEEYKMKFTVLPGVTGLNQAILRNSASMEERVKNDLFYVKNISFILDIKIVVLTLISVLRSKNITRND
ncbi:sugar transferase [Enterococcus gallinarum]|nr:sugar transferase [Enterococcus gallinarum]